MQFLKKNKPLFGIVTLALACATAQAQPTQGGVSLHYGIGDHYQRVTLNYETPRSGATSSAAIGAAWT